MSKTPTHKLGNPVAIANVASAASKAAPKVKKATKKVNADTKGALSWVIVAGVAITGIVVLKALNNASKVTNIIGSGAEVASATLDEITKAIKDPNLNASDSTVGNAGEIPLTITEAEAQNRANLLLEAMNWPGTNFQRIKQALTNITLADYVLIAEKFGTPRYNGVTGTEAYWPMPKRNLSYWLVAELDDNEVKEITTLLPGIF